MTAKTCGHPILDSSNFETDVSTSPSKGTGNRLDDGSRLKGLYQHGIKNSLWENVPASIRISRASDVHDPIIDIRRDRSTHSLSRMIREGLSCGSGQQKQLPSLALWDGNGLKLFEQVTHLPDYYMTKVETELLEQKSMDIARRIEAGSMIVELGCGDARKIRSILRALDDMGRNVDYYALDLSRSELNGCIRSLSDLSLRFVDCYGLLGTYDDAQVWLQTSDIAQRPKCILSLGSSIGNLSLSEATSFLSGFSKVLRCRKAPAGSQIKASESSMIIGIDPCKDETRVRKAYDDPARLNAKFVLNSLHHTNDILGYTAFQPKDWEVHGEWIKDSYHQWLVPLSDVTFEGTLIEAGERVHIVQSQKYSAKERAMLWKNAGLREVYGWPSQDPSFSKDPMLSMLTLVDGF